MSEYTPNLNLFKYDPINDSKEPFDIEKCLNENWDKLDQKVGLGGFNLFDTKITDHILQGNDAVGWLLQGSLVTMVYPDAVNKIKELYEGGTDTTYRGIACKKSTDGRYIADIGVKGTIDALFNTTGIADFYILDTTNSQFYLPRSKWFYQFTLDTSLINIYNEPALPDHNHTYNTKSSDLPQAGQVTNCWVGNSKTTTGNASESNPIYKQGVNTVQPPSSNKLLYYKVGNIAINEIPIDVAEVLNDLSDLQNGVFSDVGKAEITSWGFPSGEYEEWTLGASGQIYTAPCDGTLVLSKYGKAVGEHIQFNATEATLTSKNMMLVGDEATSTFSLLYCDMNMLKGQQTKIYYNAAGDIMAFRFIYAKGAK